MPRLLPAKLLTVNAIDQDALVARILPGIDDENEEIILPVRLLVAEAIRFVLRKAFGRTGEIFPSTVRLKNKTRNDEPMIAQLFEQRPRVGCYAFSSGFTDEVRKALESYDFANKELIDFLLADPAVLAELISITRRELMLLLYESLLRQIKIYLMDAIKCDDFAKLDEWSCESINLPIYDCNLLDFLKKRIKLFDPEKCFIEFLSEIWSDLRDDVKNKCKYKDYFIEDEDIDPLLLMLLKRGIINPKQLQIILLHYFQDQSFRGIVVREPINTSAQNLQQMLKVGTSILDVYWQLYYGGKFIEDIGPDRTGYSRKLLTEWRIHGKKAA